MVANYQTPTNTSSGYMTVQILCLSLRGSTHHSSFIISQQTSLTLFLLYPMLPIRTICGKRNGKTYNKFENYLIKSE